MGERGVDRVRHPTPHADVPGVAVRLHPAARPVHPPVHVAADEVGALVVTPSEYGVDAGQVLWQAEVRQWPAGPRVVTLEQPVLLA